MSVHDLLASGVGLREAIRSLALQCLAAQGPIALAREDQATWKIVKHVIDAVDAISAETWEEILSGSRPLADVWQAPGVADAMLVLESRPPLDAYAMFWPLAGKGLGRWAAATRDVLELEDGDVYPVPFRELPKSGRRRTPAEETKSTTDVLEGLPMRVYRRQSGELITVVLDFSIRELLDEATWHPQRATGPLPKVATIHPYRTFEELDFDRRPEDGWFFNVRPRNFDESAVTSQLAAAHTCDIGVLPELSLPEPAALADALQARPEAYPKLVVAGSAHAREMVDGREVRMNRSIMYFKGAPVLEHRKIHPLDYRVDGLVLRERLSPGPGVLRCLSSCTTRLTTVICADLIDRNIPGILQDVGVNLLLVPALTPHEGSFNQTAAGIAGATQGITTIVNGAPPVHQAADSEPFMVLMGAPWAAPSDQTRSFAPPPAGRRAIGRFDTNEPLSSVSPWDTSPYGPSD